MMVKCGQQEPDERRGNDRTQGVHHSLKTKRAPVTFAINSRGKECLANGRTYSTPEPSGGTQNQDLPCRRRQTESRDAECRQSITENCDEFSPLQVIGVVARS